MSERTLILLLAAANCCLGQNAREIMEKSQRSTQARSQHYEGILTVLSGSNRVAEKRWVYDRLGSHGQSKAVLRFTAPPEVKGVALLVINYPDRSSDQWMWTPAIGRERRIALQDRATRFFGTDFSFEDLEERDIGQFDFRLLTEEACGDSQCWKIEARPKSTKSSQYTHSYVWVRKDTYGVAQIEGWKKEKLVRRIRYTNWDRVDNIWTARRIEVDDLTRKSRTILQLEKLQYNVPQDDNDFTLQALRRQPG